MVTCFVILVRTDSLFEIMTKFNCGVLVKDVESAYIVSSAELLPENLTEIILVAEILEVESVLIVSSAESQKLLVPENLTEIILEAEILDIIFYLL